MRTPPPPQDDLRFSNTTGILQKKTMWFIGVEVEQETSAPPPKKNPESAPAHHCFTARVANQFCFRVLIAATKPMNWGNILLKV